MAIGGLIKGLKRAARSAKLKKGVQKPSDTRGAAQKKVQKTAIKSKSSASGATVTTASTRVNTKAKTLSAGTGRRLSASVRAGEKDSRNIVNRTGAGKPKAGGRKAPAASGIKSDIKAGLRKSKAGKTKKAAGSARARVKSKVNPTPIKKSVGNVSKLMDNPSTSARAISAAIGAPGTKTKIKGGTLRRPKKRT